MTLRRRPVLRTVAGALVLLTGMAVQVPAAVAAAPVPATYSATISPTAAPVGAVRTYTVTITNSSLLDSALVLNAATITIPADYTGITVGTPSAPLARTFDASLSGRTISLRGLLPTDQLLPGEAVTVPVTTTAPTTPALTTWTTTAADTLTTTAFALTGPQPTVSITTGTASHLVFGQQPTTTQANVAMAPAPTVLARDAFGNQDPTFNGPVTLSYAVNPNGAAAPTGATVNAVAGKATFGQLAIATTGFGYRLLAGSGTLTSDPSAAFDVVGAAVLCRTNRTCDTGVVNGPSIGGAAPTTTARSVATTGASTETLTLTVGGGAPAPVCAGFTPAGAVLTSNVTGNDRSQTVTMTLSKSLRLEESDNGLPSYRVCFGQPLPFTTESGAGSTLNPATGEHEGILAGCDSAPAPCLESRSIKKSTVVLIYRTKPGDPRSIGG